MKLINEDGNNHNKYKESDFLVFKPIKESIKISNIEGKENKKNSFDDSDL